MPVCFFASDLHGRGDRYRTLFARIREDLPAAVFLGGDLLPFGGGFIPQTDVPPGDFVLDFLVPSLGKLRKELRDRYPRVFLILGNDDPKSAEPSILNAEKAGLWSYVHGRWTYLRDRRVYGYACVPPTPFRLKDWERYDTGSYVPPGSISPEEGMRSTPEEPHAIRTTIASELASLAGNDDVARSLWLFHTPPADTNLDRAALDGQFIEYVPLDVHVGSIAVRRFIEARRPAVTLHGHIHESARLTGQWRDRIGATHLFTAAHDGPELALVCFDPEDPEGATRLLL